MSENKAVDIAPDATATPLDPGPPVDVPAFSQMGATFAERAAAWKKVEKKAMHAGDVEDKAVSSSTSKASARKKA